MRILHVVRQFHPAVGGLETYVKSMALRQLGQGHEIEVLTLNKVFHGKASILPEKDNIEGITIRRVGFIGMRRYFVPFISPAYFRQFDVVHVHNTDVFFDYVGLITRFSKRPAFATTHGGFFHTKKYAYIKNIYFKTFTRFSSRAYEAIFAISQNDFDTFKGLNDNVILLPNAIEPIGNFIAEGNDLIYLGRLAKHKNVRRLIETHAILKENYAHAGDLHIVGPEWDVTLAELQALAKRLNVLGSVRFHGFMTPPDLQVLIKRCGFYVSASSFEGFGMSMLEAMTVGLIPFVYPNESFTELVNQARVGALVNYDLPEQAAQVIAKTIAGSVTLEDREKAQNFARLYSWEELSAKTFEAYTDALR